MKRLFTKRRKSPTRRRGMALVLVLGFLVLISGLVLAFFSSVQNELASAKAYASGANTKQLADTAVQIVMGAIRTGTSRGSGVAWASQPGMIRTYGTDSGLASSAPLAFYKLYSSENMVVTKDQTAGFRPEDDVPVNWAQAPASYTDLNAPVTKEDGTPLFPIIDPAALDSVDGFSVTNAPVSASGNSTANLIPMPVRWMYILRDGTLTAPDEQTGPSKVASFAKVPAYKQPTPQNPIVGRVAFWTDDETCKLNVNTASEPTPWDTPRSLNIHDLNYGLYQPGNKEYQRYPGHPFMNALSPVFFPNPPDFKQAAVVTLDQKKAIYDLVPRVATTGGSNGGTTQVDAGIKALTPDRDRIYANVDEFLLTAPNRTPNTLLTASQLRSARFFLTANSRAPEVNLFNLPRVSIWPEPSVAANRTAFDKLIAFCAQTGDGTPPNPFKPYYFQRNDATSPTNDYDKIKIPRNEQLYAYLQALTSKKIPGAGGVFSTKWTSDRDQVLTEIFDYIRCTNLGDPQVGATKFATKGTTLTGQVTPIKIGSTQGFGRFHSISQFGLQFIRCAQVDATGKIKEGAFDVNTPALNPGACAVEAAILFEPFSPSLGYYELYESITYKIQVSGMTLNGTPLQFPSSVTASSGVNDSNRFGGIFHGRYWGGAQGVRGTIVRFGGATYPLVSKRVQVIPSKNNTMSFGSGTVTVEVLAGSSTTPIQKFTIDFPGADFPVPALVKSGTTAYRGTADTQASAWWTFKGWTDSSTPGKSVPVPGRFSLAGKCPHAPGPEYIDPKRRWGTSGGNPGFKEGSVFRAEDVVRTMVPEHGDIRLIAASQNPGNLFVTGNSYRDPMVFIDHIFSEPQGPHMLYGFANEAGPAPASGLAATNADDQLTASADVTYHYARFPEIRAGAGKKYNFWNDFDNGFAHMTDGAYINKPDEGNVMTSKSSSIANTRGYSYFSWDFLAPTEVFFSPSRLVPSAGMFGSLPTGVKRNQPWQTLLFRPDITIAGKPAHPGAASPKDHLIMDLFWMPVVEPYAISEPFSTAGKVNINYQIAPFTYIRRATALYGAFKSEMPLVIPNKIGSVNVSKVYKLWDHETNDWPYFPDSANCMDATVAKDWKLLFEGKAPYDKLRRPILMSETLKQADERFAGTGAFAGKPDLFHSASEICELHLVREGESLSDYTSGKIWREALVTGENTRERTYTNLYAKLTTKSNTYTVHFRVQTLKKRLGAGIPASDPRWLEWDESKDAVLGDYRGSTLIERYIDPSDPDLPDFTLKANLDSNYSLDSFPDPDPNKKGSLKSAYKFRILSTKKFGI